MTRRTQVEPGITPAPVTGPVIAPVSGSSALDTAPYVGSSESFGGRPLSMPPTATDKAPPTAVPPAAEVSEPRTARATLHPGLVAAIAPHSVVAERYRAIRTRLMQAEEAGPLRTI